MDFKQEYSRQVDVLCHSANAISGELKNPHVINQDMCIKCGQCVTLCKFGAISAN